MGCRLPKLRKTEDRHSPGNIYSTLRRPQVETKVGVAYTYHFLDFLLGKEEVPVSSVLCLSSVRELPVQVRELYAQGFVLVAVHPFVHPCGPRHAHIQRQLHRAVLVRETQSLEKKQWRWSRSRLETDICVAGQQAADPEVIQSYVKRIQDVAEQGVTFVGFLQQPGGGLYISGHWDPEELSSLHSSPSPIHRHRFSSNASPTGPDDTHPNGIDADFSCCESQNLDLEALKLNKQDQNTLVPREQTFFKYTHVLELNQEDSNKHVQSEPQSYATPDSGSLKDDDGLSLPEKTVTLRQQEWQQSEGKQNLPEATETYLKFSNQRQRRCSSSDSWVSSPELDSSRDRKPMNADGQSRVTTHNNNNHIRMKSSHRDKSANSPQPQNRMQLFALYNHSEELNSSLRFYALRVPLRVQKDAGLITEVDANWLDHMTQHFSSGARLIDGFFHLPDDNDSGVSSVDSVFIFQRSAEETSSVSYDAIVVEQWTVVDGVVVKTDYIPLLQSLAPYGWRLMCVLPTPIVKTNSDGSLSTKQILFLQRPVLQRKRKDFKKLNLRGRSKAKKGSAGEALDEQENRSLVMETEMDRLRLGAEEEEEDEGSGSRASLQRREDVRHQRNFLFERRASAEDQEEETDIDESPLSKLEKSVRWTDFCQKCDGGGKEECSFIC